MLSRLLFVRLKAAENALRDGRLDEAYRLATAPDIREHRRGAAVLAKLTERFLERASSHFRADRFTEAVMDLDKAEAGQVKKEEVAELREHVRTVMAEQQRREQSRANRNEAAKRRIEDGSLAAGRKMLERAAESDLGAQQLRKAAEDRAGDAANIVEQAERLIGQGQLAAAAQRIRRAQTVDAHNEAAARVETHLCNHVFDNARNAIRDARLSRAADELACLGKLGDALPAKREISDILVTAQEAARCVGSHQYAEALRHVMRLSRLAPDAKWLEDVAGQLRSIDDNFTALCAGPLGGRVNGGGATPEIVGAAHARVGQALEPGGRRPPQSVEDTVALPRGLRSAGSLPERLLLLVDGGGSYLLLRSPQASLGRVASNNQADVPIFGDLAERHANIARVDDDYFIFSSKAVEVAGRKTCHQLLRDGDRIVLGRKAKLTLRVPSRKSPTAVLDLSDTTKMPNDVRRVILFHQHATVGSGPSAHIRCQHAGTPMVLFERKGALWLRTKNDGHVDTDAVRLPIGEPIEIAGVSLVLEPWKVRTPGDTSA